MTPEQKRAALAKACSKTPISVCSDDRYIDSCPVCGGKCTYFGNISDRKACHLYAEAVRRGAIKEEQ